MAVVKRYKLTDEQLADVRKAASTPGVFLGGPLAGYDPAQHAIEDFWKKLGKEMGFDWSTVKGVQGEGQEVFEAEEVDDECSL